MTQQQIEKAARGLVTAQRNAGIAAWLETDECERIVDDTTADFLTRFSQQVEADALERSGLFTRERVEAVQDEILAMAEPGWEDEDGKPFKMITDSEARNAFTKLLKPKTL